MERWTDSFDRQDLSLEHFNKSEELGEQCRNMEKEGENVGLMAFVLP